MRKQATAATQATRKFVLAVLPLETSDAWQQHEAAARALQRVARSPAECGRAALARAIQIIAQSDYSCPS